MGRRIVTVLEILIVVTLFSMFGGLIITSATNDAIIEHTEDFVETVRYKGCITDDMYYEFIDGFNSVVDVSFIVTKKATVSVEGSDDVVDTIELTNNVVSTFQNSNAAARIYKMNVGDEIEVIVRKPSGNYYDRIMGSLTGQMNAGENPIIARKGGMILNTQYAE
jgi:hypothetical protein